MSTRCGESRLLLQSTLRTWAPSCCARPFPSRCDLHAAALGARDSVEGGDETVLTEPEHADMLGWHRRASTPTGPSSTAGTAAAAIRLVFIGCSGEVDFSWRAPQ